MSESVEKWKMELAKLSSEDRSELADFLLDGLEAEGIFCGETEAEFVTELNRRMEEIRSGQEVGIPIEVVLKELREKFP